MTPQEIQRLKLKNKALVLAHFYEDGDIQDVADAVGDSLYLAQTGQDSDAETVLLAGVVFMAESVKILSPNKKVLVPDLSAGCSLVQHAPADKFRRWRETFPEHICVTYINSSAEVKALSDVICTSSNAEKILRSIPEDRGVCFAPDRHLGGYLSKKLNRPMELWPGFCEVHVLFSAQKLAELRREHPEARVLAHPECDERVLAQSDVVGSTSRLLEEVKLGTASQYIVATEDGIFHQMRKARPGVELIQAPAEGSCACNQCPYMKLNNLEKIARALETGTPEVSVRPEIMERARLPLERMMKITRGEPVHWPTRFSAI